MNKETGITRNANGWALLPLAVFFLLYIVTLACTGDMSKMPISVAFLVTSVVAIFASKGGTLMDKVAIFCRGCANETITLMIVIFILAGAFAATARSMGAVDATVNMMLYLLPAQTILASIFIAACFISMAMGTSCGTIAALAPIGVGIASQIGVPLPSILAVVIGGAMFGDNLSFISDTTIAATRTQGCELKDKFLVNIRLVLPVTIIMLFVYLYQGFDIVSTITVDSSDIEWIKVLPYVVVLITALAGMNVIAVLALGIVLSGGIGLATGAISVWGWTASMSHGIVVDMGELIIVSLMAGGVFGMITYNGGIEWMIAKITKKIKSKRSAELAISGLVSITNVCTANNTIAIIVSGPIAKNISDRFKLDSRKVASLLDTFSCFIQGMLPYGAQLLIAAGIAKVNPVSIIPYLYYPVLLGVIALICILLRLPRKYS